MPVSQIDLTSDVRNVLPIASGGTGTNFLAYDLLSTLAGKPSDGQVVFLMKAARAFTLPADLAGSVGRVGTNPTATATYTVLKNGSAVGSIQISTSGAFTFSTAGSPVSLSVGDELAITAPSPADNSLADVSITLAGMRVTP
jgi:hypothetical protein